jgi:hypothetical protein
MPSPFPGMDPYIENPRWFPSFHDSFITYLQEALQPLVPTPYYALSNRRVWVEVSSRHVTPDVSVLKPEKDVPAPRGAGATAVATAPPAKPVVVTVSHEERHETFLEVFASGEDGDRLVTSIELLSIANKTSGANNRDLYIQKQREMLESGVNLVEIDLLRAGDHTTAVPNHLAVEKCGKFDYHTYVHRFDRADDFFVYAILLNSPLPVIDIPLLPRDADIPLDLQQVFDRTYDAGPFARKLRYEQESPKPTLTDDQAKWAAEWLKSKLT